MAGLISVGVVIWRRQIEWMYGVFLKRDKCDEGSNIYRSVGDGG